MKHGGLLHTNGVNLAQASLQQGAVLCSITRHFFTRALVFQVASHGTWGPWHMCCEMLDQRDSKFPFTLRFYNGSRKGTRAAFSLLPE